MAGNENQRQQAASIFDRSLQVIGESHVPRVNTIAKRTARRVQTGELPLIGINRIASQPSITGFDLLELAREPKLRFTPAVTIDIGEILTSTKDVVQGDIVRTAAVADQYPNNGYERRYAGIYGDAFQAQTDWLEATNTPPVPLDPRDSDTDELLRNLIGEARHYLDVGFADWQASIDEHRPELDPSLYPTIDHIRDAADVFVSARQLYVPQYYQYIKENQDAETLSDDPEIRVQSVAKALLSSTLFMYHPEY